MKKERFSWSDLVRWGALELYPEERVRAWMGGRDEMTVLELFEAKLPASIVFWTVVRPELVDEVTIHKLALELAETLLSQHRARGRYLDFRTARLLDKKREWIAGTISLGALSVARHAAEDARRTVAELQDPRVWVAAKAVVQASGVDAREAFRQTFYTVLEYDDEPREAHVLALVRRGLGLDARG